MNEKISKDFAKEPGCVPLVRKAFAAMDDSFKKGDYSTLNNAFKLCNPISDEAGYHHLLLWMRNAFTIMAMVDYPYPASFLGIIFNILYLLIKYINFIQQVICQLGLFTILANNW